MPLMYSLNVGVNQLMHKSFELIIGLGVLGFIMTAAPSHLPLVIVCCIAGCLTIYAVSKR